LAAKIKLKRVGKKKKPFYRVIIQDESEARRGRSVDEIGFYNPLLESNKFEVNKEKVLDWLSKGAEPTEKVRILLGKAGILPPISFEGKPKRKPRSKEGAQEGAPAPEGAAAPAPAEKKEEPKAEEPKKEAPKKEEPKVEEPKKEEPKPAEKPAEAKAEAKEEKKAA
jgi:small subunit ribosomal protein S16